MARRSWISYKRPITYGLTKSASVAPGSLSYSLEGLQFDVRSPRGPIRVRSKLVGRPNVYNILAAVAATSALDVPIEAIEQGLERLAGVPGRFEIASSPADDVTVVVDYAHTDDALRNLLETARPVAVRRLITVFGAGGDRDRTKRPLMGMVAARLSDVVVITSDNPRSEDPNRIIDEVKRGADAETRQSGAEVLIRPGSPGCHPARRRNGRPPVMSCWWPARGTRSTRRSGAARLPSTMSRWRGRHWHRDG